MANKKKFDVNVHYDVVIPVKDIIAEDEDSAMEIAINNAMYVDMSEGEVVDTRACVTSVISLEEIMNTTNSHNPHYVEIINEVWNTKDGRQMVEDLVKVLMLRDTEECVEKDIPLSDTHSYLMQVADDYDLECIIRFLHKEH